MCHAFQVSHAVFLLLPSKKDTASHPVKMEYWQCNTPIRTKCPSYFMNSKKLKVLSNSEGNQPIVQQDKDTELMLLPKPATSVSIVCIDTCHNKFTKSIKFEERCNIMIHCKIIPLPYYTDTVQNRAGNNSWPPANFRPNSLYGQAKFTYSWTFCPSKVRCSYL